MAFSFPPGFVWGTATAAYQIEGAVREDGRGTSIWDTFSHMPGKTHNGDTGDVACDHYHRAADDVALMREIGVNGYRFSVAWSRIFPEGRGAVNQKGLDWYERLVEHLLKAGITPYVTLYHWDLPQTLQSKGGWPNRDTAEAFALYAETVSKRLGDRVQHWITHNEPWCAAFLGHFQGEHAPGIQDVSQALGASHHLLVSHGLAAQAIRSTTSRAKVGITLNLTPGEPATDSNADAEATQLFDGFFNRWFLDPLHGRGYPDDMLQLYNLFLPTPSASDVALIAQPLDFLGVNYYFRALIRHDPSNILGFSNVPAAEIPGAEQTAMGWEVSPAGLGTLLARIHRDYAPPAIYITENGAAFEDQLEDGEVHDPQRVQYLHDHFAQAQQAIMQGVPLRGYFVWSLLDNFEWAYGYSKRFGITYVNYATQERILKDSGKWYQRVIGENVLVDAE